jgi:hypothetical protein
MRQAVGHLGHIFFYFGPLGGFHYEILMRQALGHLGHQNLILLQAKGKGGGLDWGDLGRIGLSLGDWGETGVLSASVHVLVVSTSLLVNLWGLIYCYKSRKSGGRKSSRRNSGSTVVKVAL